MNEIQEFPADRKYKTTTKNDVRARSILAHRCAHLLFHDQPMVSKTGVSRIHEVVDGGAANDVAVRARLHGNAVGQQLPLPRLQPELARTGSDSAAGKGEALAISADASAVVVNGFELLEHDLAPEEIESLQTHSRTNHIKHLICATCIIHTGNVTSVYFWASRPCTWIWVVPSHSAEMRTSRAICSCLLDLM